MQKSFDTVLLHGEPKFMQQIQHLSSVFGSLDKCKITSSSLWLQEIGILELLDKKGSEIKNR